jgi:hypothetical protein
MGFYTPTPNHTDAYHKDASNNEYFGKAAKFTNTSMAGWAIFKMEYTGSNWVIKYPVDTDTGVASAAPKFIWDDVESYTYSILGT